jgi:hypothetical protein
MTRRLSHVKTINLEFHFNGCCEMMFVEVRNYGFVNFICFFVSGAQQFSCLVLKEADQPEGTEKATAPQNLYYMGERFLRSLNFLRIFPVIFRFFLTLI